MYVIMTHVGSGDLHVVLRSALQEDPATATFFATYADKGFVQLNYRLPPGVSSLGKLPSFSTTDAAKRAIGGACTLHV